MIRKVLYVGFLWSGSTCIPRLSGLRSTGLDVVELDATPCFRSGWRPVDSISHRLYCTPSVWRMNDALLRMASQADPDLVWIEKGDWVYPSTLRKLRRYAEFLVHYNTDDIFGKGSYFWLHRLGIRSYDLHVTTNRWNVTELRRVYGVRSFRAGMGYDQDFHRPPPPDSLPVAEAAVVFVGHWEPHTESYIMALRDSGVPVKVWGHNWRKARNRSLRSIQPLPHLDYVRTISSAKIALCILSCWNRNESTGRSFEIPAIGTCMLAERTFEHVYLYGEDEGALLFSDEKELVEKASGYLADEKARTAVAAAGRQRCEGLKLSWGEHIRREWPLIENALCGSRMPERGSGDSPFWGGFRDGEEYREATCPCAHE